MDEAAVILCLEFFLYFYDPKLQEQLFPVLSAYGRKI